MSRHAFGVGALVGLLLAASISYATSNLNLSKSNINRVVHPPVVTPAVATAILTDLDKLPPGADEATIRATVHKHLGTLKSAHGGNLIIRVRPPGGAPKLRTILILENAADENEAAMKAGYDIKANKRSIQ